MTYHLERTLSLPRNESNVFDRETRFPQKLWDTLCAGRSNLIWWSDDGLSIIAHYDNFERDVMKRHPGLVQIPSFANFRRQLRWYGFDWKVKDIGQFEFIHPCFRRDGPELLERVVTKRKAGRHLPIPPEGLYSLRAHRNRLSISKSPTSSSESLTSRRPSSLYKFAGAAAASFCLSKRRGRYRAYGRRETKGNNHRQYSEYSDSYHSSEADEDCTPQAPDVDGVSSLVRPLVISPQPRSQEALKESHDFKRRSLTVALSFPGGSRYTAIDRDPPLLQRSEQSRSRTECPRECPCVCHHMALNPGDSAMDWFYSCLPYAPTVTPPVSANTETQQEEQQEEQGVLPTYPGFDREPERFRSSASIPVHFYDNPSPRDEAASGLVSLAEAVNHCDSDIGLYGTPVALKSISPDTL